MRKTVIATAIAVCMGLTTISVGAFTAVHSPAGRRSARPVVRFAILPKKDQQQQEEKKTEFSSDANDDGDSLADFFNDIKETSFKSVPHCYVTIGVLKEERAGEKRVSQTPEEVKKLIQRGFTVIVEEGAGLDASFADADYIDTGAVVLKREQVLNDADIFTRMHPPPPSLVPKLAGKTLRMVHQPHIEIDPKLYEQLDAQRTRVLDFDLGDDEGIPIANTVNKDKFSTLAKDHFEGAKDGSDILDEVSRVIKARGFTAENTLFAQSVCPDEINHEKGDITELFSSYFGKVFHLGGLAGIPFVGTAGFAAFSHHVPDDGHCFILMAPHIGISESGKLGMYTRDGQGGVEGTACGAAVGALRHCQCHKHEDADESSIVDTSDFQMNYIIQEIGKCRHNIEKCETENGQQAALAKETWKIAKRMLDEIANTDFGGEHSKLVVLTGVQINMPRPCQDMFQPLTFDLYSPGGCVEDLFEETFGPKPKA